MRGLIAPSLSHVGRFLVGNRVVWLSSTRRFRWRILAFLPPSPSEPVPPAPAVSHAQDRKSTRLNSSHPSNSYAVFCLKKNNDPLELTTDVKYLFIRGQLTSMDNRHLRLYEKYSKRPKAQ